MQLPTRCWRRRACVKPSAAREYDNMVSDVCAHIVRCPSIALPRVLHTSTDSQLINGGARYTSCPWLARDVPLARQGFALGSPGRDIISLACACLFHVTAAACVRSHVSWWLHPLNLRLAGPSRSLACFHLKRVRHACLQDCFSRADYLIAFHYSARFVASRRDVCTNQISFGGKNIAHDSTRTEALARSEPRSRSPTVFSLGAMQWQLSLVLVSVCSALIARQA